MAEQVLNPPMSPRIRAEHLEGLPGLRRTAREAILARQPETVLQALSIPDVGRKTLRHLFELGVISDPAGLQGRRMTEGELEVYIAGKHPEWARRR